MCFEPKKTAVLVTFRVNTDYSAFIRRRQSSGFYRRILGPVSDHVLINRASKELALYQVIKYCRVLYQVQYIFFNLNPIWDSYRNQTLLF